MVFLLSDQNVFQYLIEQKVIKQEEQLFEKIESKICKNFNLLIYFMKGFHLLIKQEPHDHRGDTNEDFLNEWQIHKLVLSNAELSHIQPMLSEAIHFDRKHSILVFNYLVNYCDLDDFYTQQQIFPDAIAASLGAALAKVHRATCNRQDYKKILTANQTADDETIKVVPNFSHELEAITPETFGTMSADGLKFYELYQRYESLGQALRELNAAYEPCCLIHNDLKLGNVLLHLEWKALLVGSQEESKEHSIRLIDWEKWLWGDPASDVGTLVASYLKIWLKSLVVKAGIDLNTALCLASIPLEAVQPSIVAIVQSYLTHFPAVLERFPDFLQRVMQFTGLALIESIQAKLHYHEPFGNIEICMLQVAKTLLCTPLESIPTVFGISASELLNLNWQLPLKTWQLHSIYPETCSQEADSEDLPKILSGTETLSHPYVASFTPEFTQEAMLHDLVSNIKIHANFCIHHPHYVPSEPPKGLGEHLLQFPVNLQRNYLRVQLQNYLYDIYFSGEQALATTVEIESPPQVLENNTVRGLNMQFYEQLHSSNSGEGYFDLEWRVLRQELDGTLAVQKDGLTVHIQPEQHLHATGRSPAIGEFVAIRLPRNRVETGFYVAVGNAGLVSEQSPTIELYFNLTPGGAVSLMRSLTQHLNAIGIPFLFKVVSDPVNYGRYDSGILQVERSHYEEIWPVLQQIYETAASCFQSTVPLFTKVLAPGIGLAEEPEREDSIGGFGMNRCQRVADALLSVWQTGKDSPQTRMNAIHAHFIQHEIDWQHPYLNAKTEDIYTLLGYI